MHQPRKRFGQNFLQSEPIISAIVSLIHPQKADNMLEIGPGLGALTAPLLSVLDRLTAVELDRDLIARFKDMPSLASRLTLIEADALKVDYHQFGEALRVVGNLPYNISTPLILHLLDYHAVIKDMHFMLQQEVVQRMAASPGTKAFGRLSVMVQYFCKVEALLDVPPEAFFPAPKVNSQIVRLTPYQTLPYAKVSMPLFQKVVMQAFSMRRKTLSNTLKPLIRSDELVKLGIDPKARAEQLSVNDYVKLAIFLEK